MRLRPCSPSLNSYSKKVSLNFPDVLDRPRSVQRSQEPEDPETADLEIRNVLSQVSFSLDGLNARIITVRSWVRILKGFFPDSNRRLVLLGNATWLISIKRSVSLVRGQQARSARKYLTHDKSCGSCGRAVACTITELRS